MITRIVKLTINPSQTEEFSKIFKENHSIIASFPGCLSVEVLRDTQYENVFFTYSKWDSLESIENYRKSDIFRNIWSQAKKTFCAKPEAWSLINDN